MGIKSSATLYASYQFIKLLSKPFSEWPAFKNGTIDKKGNIIKKNHKDPDFSRFHVLVRNIKRIINKIPFASSSIGSFASALWLLKEETGLDFTQKMADHFNVDLQLNESDIDIICIRDKMYIRNNRIIIVNDKIGQISDIPILEGIDFITKERVIFVETELEEILMENNTTANIPTGPDSVFMNKPVFNCPDDTFYGCIQGRKKHKKWKTTLGDTETLGRIKSWKGQSRKNTDFILKNNKTSEMIMLN